MAHKLQIAHIHSYKNFIDRSTRWFENEYIDNSIFYLSNQNDYKGVYIENILLIPTNKSSVRILIKKCSKFDIVVVYNLDGLKSYILNRLPSSTTVIWRFFGMELYGKMKSEVFSVYEKEYFEETQSKIETLELFKRIKIKSTQLLLWGTSMEKEKERAYRNIDFFLGLSLYEYRMLKERFDLPLFLQHPLALYNVPDTSHIRESRKILIGNNRSPYNNYLEIINILRKYQNSDIRFYIQFSYGSKSNYSEEVRRLFLELKNVTLIESFVKYEEYEELFKSMGAFVLNGYRQMGMGALFNALVKGLKVYLNPKNVVYDWLISEGFLVFDIKDLELDLVNENFNLTKVEKSTNLEVYSDISKKYSIELFQESVLNLI